QRTENPRVTGSIPVGTTPVETQHLASLFLCTITTLETQDFASLQKGTKKAHPQRKRFFI
ncbi:MAG: hypothetical protein J6P83_05965, partial [Bacteroidales bacterium]|nr:hypothetical protein [Bacteroidales bacterium]